VSVVYLRVERAHVGKFVCVCACARERWTGREGEWDRPTQSFIYVPLLVCVFHRSILLIVQYKYLESCSKDFKLLNLILCTRLCGTGFIPQHC